MSGIMSGPENFNNGPMNEDLCFLIIEKEQMGQEESLVFHGVYESLQKAVQMSGEIVESKGEDIVVDVQAMRIGEGVQLNNQGVGGEKKENASYSDFLSGYHSQN